jgi:hypothetical protein
MMMPEAPRSIAYRILSGGADVAQEFLTDNDQNLSQSNQIESCGKEGFSCL